MSKHLITNIILQNTTQSNATNAIHTAARSARRRQEKPAMTGNPQTAEQRMEMQMLR
jgi:hypothetical protein